MNLATSALLGVGLLAVLAAPGGVLLWTPLLLGVPHLAGDVRALWARPLWPVSRALGPCLALTAVVLVSLRVAPWLGWTPAPALEVAVGAGALAVGAALAPSGGGRVVAAVGVGGLLALSAAPTALVLLGHLHNVVAVVLAAAWSGRGGRALLVWAVAGAVVSAWGAGPLDAPEHAAFARGLGATLAPGLSDAAAAASVRVYAWLQLVHYAVWLWILPRARRDDGGWSSIGAPAWAVLGVAACAVPLAAWWGTLGPAGVRGAYLSIASFHGWLELVVLAHWWARR